jgi:hypothetical protein
LPSGGPGSMIPFVAGKASEVVFIPQAENVHGSISFANKESLLRLSEKKDLIIMGSGNRIHLIS